MKTYSSFKNSVSGFYQKWWPVLHISLIVLVGAAIYSNTMNSPFVMDDITSIGYNGKVSLLDILLNSKTRRISNLTFAINNNIHGLQATGYHLTNIAIHILAAVTLYFVAATSITALQTVSETDVKTSCMKKLVPLTVALFFVSHPVQTQAVTYIIQRHTSLATLFYLVSTLSFLKFRLALAQRSSKTYILWVLTAIITGTLALGCKQIAVTLPVVLFFIEVFIFRGELINKKFYLACLAIASLLILAGAIKWHESSWHDFIYDLDYATSEDHSTSRITYFLTQICVIATYLRLLFLPLGQSLFHDFPLYRSLFALPVIASIILHTLIMLLAIVLFHKSRKNLQAHDTFSGIMQRLASFGVIWFYVTMSLESSIFPIRDIIFEHRIYLPSVGFFLTVTSLIALMTHKKSIILWSVIMLTTLVLGSLTIARNHVWSSALTLWQDTVNKAPNNGLAIASLGGAYLADNKPDKALPFFLRAIEMNANFQAFHLGEALKRLNIDEARFTTGKEFIFPEGGVVSDRLDKNNVMKYEVATKNTMALAYEYLGEFKKARQCYISALSMNPDYDMAWYNLGLLSIRTGENQQLAYTIAQLKRLNSVLAINLAEKVSRQ